MLLCYAGHCSQTGDKKWVFGKFCWQIINTGSRIAQSVMQELGIYWNNYLMCYKLWGEYRDSRIDGSNESASYQQRQSEELLNRNHKPSVTQHHICNIPAPPPSYIMPPSLFGSGKAVVCKKSFNGCQNCMCRSSSHTVITVTPCT